MNVRRVDLLRLVLDGHVVAGERHHLGAVLDVEVVEARPEALAQDGGGGGERAKREGGQHDKQLAVGVEISFLRRNKSKCETGANWIGSIKKR